MRVAPVAVLLAALLLTGCEAARPVAESTPVESPSPVGTVADGLDTPWGVARLPDGELLVGSRDQGRVTRVSLTGGARVEVGTVPGVRPGGEGGLLGLALSPGFAEDRAVYAYFTAEEDNRIVRLRYQDDQLTDPRTVLTGIPKGSNHDGGRIAFGPDGMLYAGTGEAGRTALAQDRASLGGKILRMTPDGAPAPGNPFPGSVVYSLGHRNVQGLAWDPQGRLWAAEFGQNTWDELNLIAPGGNYGWPVVEGKAGRSGYVDPFAQWTTAEASPSGIAYADGAIWMAALRGTRLWQVPLDGSAPTARLVDEYGRLRTVLAEPAGTLLVTTSNTDGRGRPRDGDDRVLRVSVPR
ncbi:PQQ-dependent sugar dehydrogenase [Kitasatospora sp. NPDC101801]|uniref:PQQ-dependent sugar dehydrogenase n=1 Tax=Kitasatospora sp. NPDC101801 TaxID=3364103 RepID=UPI0037FC7065